MLADSKGDVAQAAKILSGTLTRDFSDTTAVERVDALAFLAELSVRLDDGTRAAELVAEIDAVPLTETDERQVATVVDQAHDLRESLGGDPSRHSQ